MDQALALTVAAEAAERQGRTVAAEEARTRARALAQAAEPARGRLAVSLRLAPRAANKAEAEKALRAALAEAERIGWCEARLEAGLALAAFEPGAEGLARRAAVAREAAAKGFGEIAGRASR